MDACRSALVICLSLFFAACSSGGGEAEVDPAPVIGEIYTDIRHLHDSFEEKWGGINGLHIDYTFLVRIEDPQGRDNLDEVYIYDKTNDLYYDVVGGPGNIAADYYLDRYYMAYERGSYSLASKDRVELVNWQVYAKDKQGNISTRDFEFNLPDGDPVADERYVYSADYGAPTASGVMGMEVMTISGNNLSIVPNPGTQSFTIEFETNERRADSFGIWFYDGSANVNYLGQANQLLSPSIASTAINFGGVTSLQLPWSELYFDASDVAGIHLVLYNQDIEIPYNTDDVWVSYLGVSEFLTF